MGYKYFLFTADTLVVTIQYRCSGKGALEILQTKDGAAAGSMEIGKNTQWQDGICALNVVPGKSALYFKYYGSGSLELRQFTFIK